MCWRYEDAFSMCQCLKHMLTQQSDWPRQGNTVHLINFMHSRHLRSLVMCCCVFTHASDTSTHWRCSHTSASWRISGNQVTYVTLKHFVVMGFCVISCLLAAAWLFHFPANILVHIYSENRLSISIAVTVILAFPTTQWFSAYHPTTIQDQLIKRKTCHHLLIHLWILPPPPFGNPIYL